MSVSIPATDIQHTNMQSSITLLGTQITNAGSNGPLVQKLTRDKASMQFQLVSSLLGSGHLSAASILSNETYVTQLSDGQ